MCMMYILNFNKSIITLKAKLKKTSNIEYTCREGMPCQNNMYFRVMVYRDMSALGA